jgi:hypothetical protein
MLVSHSVSEKSSASSSGPSTTSSGWGAKNFGSVRALVGKRKKDIVHGQIFVDTNQLKPSMFFFSVLELSSFNEILFYFCLLYLYFFLSDDKGGERMTDFDISNSNSETQTCF